MRNNPTNSNNLPTVQQMAARDDVQEMNKNLNALRAAANNCAIMLQSTADGGRINPKYTETTSFPEGGREEGKNKAIQDMRGEILAIQELIPDELPSSISVSQTQKQAAWHANNVSAFHSHVVEVKTAFQDPDFQAVGKWDPKALVGRKTTSDSARDLHQNVHALIGAYNTYVAHINHSAGTKYPKIDQAKLGESNDRSNNNSPSNRM